MRETLYHDTQRATDVIDVDWRESTFDTQKATDVIDLDWRKSTWDYATLPRFCTRMQRRKEQASCTRAQQSLDAECHVISLTEYLFWLLLEIWRQPLADRLGILPTDPSTHLE